MNRKTTDVGEDIGIRAGYYLVTDDLSRSAREMTLLDLWEILWNQRLFIVGVTTTIAVLSVVIALLIPPVYRSEVVLAPVSNPQASALGDQLGGLASLAGIRIGGGSDDAEALAVLRSRAFAEAFINEKNLMPILFSDQWDESRDSWIESDPGLQPSIFDAVKTFRENVFSVRQDLPTGLVIIAIEWTDPVLAAEWVNDIARRINAESRGRAIAETTKNLAYLDEQLQAASVVELQTAIARLIEAEIKKGMLARVREEFAFKIIDPGVVPEQRSRPHRSLIVLVSSFLGGTLAILLALLRNSIAEQMRLREAGQNAD